MADKYVKLNDIIETLDHEWGYEGMREDLYNLPAADVVEVRHGEWVETITHNGCTWDSDCVCSVCGKSGHPCNNYCEECGAKMDGERKCDND